MHVWHQEWDGCANTKFCSTVGHTLDISVTSAATGRIDLDHWSVWEFLPGDSTQVCWIMSEPQKQTYDKIAKQIATSLYFIYLIVYVFCQSQTLLCYEINKFEISEKYQLQMMVGGYCLKLKIADWQSNQIKSEACMCACVCMDECISVYHLTLQGNRQSASQPEHDLERETTGQGTKCVTWAQSFSLSKKEERKRPREGGTGRGRRLLPTRCTQKLIKSFEIVTEGTCMQSSQGKGLMRLCKAPG